MQQVCKPLLARGSALFRCASLYLIAIGGAGALLSSFITQAEVVAYAELGPEAIRKLTVAEFPVLVGYDIHGGSIFPGDEDLD